MPCKRKITLILLVSFCASLLMQSAASAGTISITPKVKPVVVDEKKGLKISVDNSGDESAKNVQIHIDFAGETLSGPRWDILKPKEEKSHTFFIETLPTTPGLHPAYVTVDFADLNMYPFTALDVTLINAGAASKPARLFGKIDNEVFIKKTGKLSFTLKNLDEEAKHVSVRVFGPKELSFDKNVPMMDLPAGESIEKSLKVTNFSALAGAGYPVFLVFEYELDNAHYTYALKSHITVQAGGISNSSRKTVTIIGIVVLVFASLAEVVRRAIKKK